jgi:exodeoxyribonuclease V gamma subunit
LPGTPRQDLALHQFLAGKHKQMFNLYLSNRSEVLVDALVRVVTDPPLAPLKKEIIVVQSQGMERWLTQQLSERLGIWANGWFPFPNAIIEDVFQRSLSEIPANQLFSSELLCWRIQRWLSGCLDLPEFETLRNYLGADKQDLKLVQLSQRVADTFDQYTLYRPEWVLEWEQGRESHWQAQLWRMLAAEAPQTHRAAIRQRFLHSLRHRKFDPSVLPKRISIFGIPLLPPFHLSVLAAISDLTEVHLFLMNPSREFWADIVSEKEWARMQHRRRGKNQLRLSFPRPQYLEAGHPLLASLGRLGRDFLGILMDQENLVDHSHYEEPGEESLLACLQSDILTLHHRGKSGSQKSIAKQDDSLQIHSCHNPLREMEVLYDRLLGLFDEHAGLEPSDVLVMTPDIETYAPYVTAVFSGVREGYPRIPYSIADRSVRAESPVIRAFFSILDLSGSRFGVSQIMDLLSSPLVRRRFGIEAEDRDRILAWVKETRIRWGIDAEERRKRGIPAFEENSWRAGLDRLLLGYALPSSGGEMFGGILPFDAIEGSASGLLGTFVEFLEQLFAVVRELECPRPLAAWSDSLLNLLSKFLAEEDGLEIEFHLLRVELRRLAEVQSDSGYDKPVGLEVIRYHLEKQLKVTQLSPAFLTGGVTFCAMLPMRSIPFRVIALVGMDDKAFPRLGHAYSFDLMASHPQAGDRSFREEDRYAFLEAILCAREHLHISYVGQSARDNSEIAPSVLVSELLDAVAEGFTLAPEGESLRDHLCIRHRLQAFSPEYFSPSSELFSYSQENLSAAQARQSSNWEPQAFIFRPIAQPPAELRRLDLQTLKRFFRNPVKFVLRQRLGMVLDDASPIIEDREPFSLEGLDAYALKQELVARRLGGQDLQVLYPMVRAQGILPAGKGGELAFREVMLEVDSFVESLKPFVSHSPLPALDLNVDMDGFKLTGTVKQVWPEHMVHFRCAPAKPKDHLDLWIEHLAVLCLARGDYPESSVLVAQDKVWHYPPIANSRSFLRLLLDLYWRGLSEPLKFFPESAFEYAARRTAGKSHEDALAAALKVWNGSEKIRGEREDAYCKVAFQQVNPLDEEFARLAVEVFEPLLKNGKEQGG